MMTSKPCWRMASGNLFTKTALRTKRLTKTPSYLFYAAQFCYVVFG
jgi:hypothetical protein